ncbi:phage tail tip lysozyme [Mesorhizobium sp. ORM16]|uniref:phage tail tip lysozyme n=1 Tax=Mesorhizobium sp. ORM16 TaxID=3376989 RepID=UPI003857241E
MNGLQLSSSATQAGLGIQIANQTQGAMSDLGRFVSPGKSAGGFFSVAGEFQPFADAIEHLRKTAKDGTPDIIGFRKMVEDKWALDPNNAALTTSAGKLMDLTKDADAAARALKQLQIAQEALAKAVGPGGLPLRRGALSTDNMGAYEQYQAAGSVSASRAQQAFDAQRQGLFARSPAELAASARAQAGAQYNDNENPAERARRIDMAGQQAALAAQHALDEAQKDRKRSLDQTLASQQLDLDLIGKTSGAAEAMRMQFQLTQQLREEAARNNVPVDQQELELIKQKADAYGEMANQIARAQLGNDLAFERSQQFLTKDEQTIASRLRGTGIGMDSPEAGQMRDMTRFGEAKDMASGFLNGFKSELLNSGGNIGKALGTSILNALTNSMDKAWSKIFDQLATAFASALTGQKPGGSGLASAGTSVVGSILGGANDNYAPGAVTRAPLAAVGSGGVAAQAWNFFKSKGLADHQVAGILGNISAESAFKPTAIGDAGNAFGLFQHNDRAPQLLSAIGGKGNLGDVQGQLDFAWKELNSSESGALARLKAAPDVRSATAAFAGFERPRGFSLANPEGADNFSGRLSGAEQALDKFGGTAAKATGSLGSLGEGMGKMGSALSQFPTAPGGGGGGGGLLGSLFGGLSSAFSGTKAFSFLSSNPGGYVNFYADGTENAPEGWAWVGERGPELKKLRSGDVIRSNPASMQMAANQNRGQSQGKVELHVHVTGASGDDHVRTLAKQGAQEAIGEYHQGQVNGGFGDTQRRYTSQKG